MTAPGRPPLASRILRSAMVKTSTRPNPVIAGDELALVLGDDPDRLERARSDPSSTDWLVWSTFAPTHRDPDRLTRLPRVLAAVIGGGVSPPARTTIFAGRDREPLARPGREYLAHLRRSTDGQGGDAEALVTFGGPVEVPVRVEAPGVLALVDAFVRTPILGAGGRDRMVELIEVGLEQSRAVGKRLVVGVIYPSRNAHASEVSARLARLRTGAGLRAALPWRSRVDDVELREVTWGEVLRTWESEAPYMGVGRRDARRFLDAARDLGLS